MKQIQVRKVPYGETFSVFGDKFVALDYINGKVLAIRKEIWKNAPFDTSGVNDLRTASITGHLVQYFEDLCKNGASEDTIAMNTMDLKATDGSREYGTFDMRAGLLTLEQYGKYQDIIPLADDWWCLATPWRTPNPGGLRSPHTFNTYYVWLVYSDGDCSDYDAADTYGIRPALYFSSSLLVSIPDDEDAAPAVDESALFQEYLDYIDAWPEEAEPGTSPMTFEEWKESMKKDGD